MYHSCQSRDLGHLGGGQSIATAINSAGVIVGKSTQAGGRWRAFAYSNGAMRDLGGSTNQGINESATAINFWGDVVGVESASGGLGPQAVRYVGGAASMMARILLHPPAGWGSIQDVVDLDDSRGIVGDLMDSGVNIAFRSDNFGNLWTRIAGVPGLESTGTTPRAMNRYGQVVGVAGNGFVRAFISRDPTAPATDLGTLGGSLSMAYGINNYGWVVGWAEQTNGGGPRAFVHDGTHMIDLNTVLWNGAGWLLREANAINDAGQIVGEGLFNNQTHAFFLQPMARAPLTEAIPCPPMAAMP
jgi:probable HAF family extracellular repeat protein